MKLTEAYKLPGIGDLTPLKCRANFAKALMAEDEGNMDEAQVFLDKALEAEAEEVVVK